MSETIIPKRCCKCKEIKAHSAFYKSRTTKDGYHYECKLCMAIYQRQYRQTGKARIPMKRYAQNHKSKTSPNHGRNVRKYRGRFPERRKAGHAVNHAIRAGILLPANTHKCSCGNQAKQYHHPSYTPEHWLHVVPFCVSCHFDHHVQIRADALKGGIIAPARVS